MLLIDVFKIAKVVRAFGINALPDDKVLSGFDADKSLSTEGTLKLKGEIAPVIVWAEAPAANLAEKLTATSIVAVEKRLRGIAEGTGTVLRNIACFAATDRRNLFAITLSVVGIEAFPVPVLMNVDNLGKFICFELLVFRGMGVVKSPLFKRNIFADKGKKPAILLVKSLNEVK